MVHRDDVGERIRELRKEEGLPQTEVARFLGVTQAYISKLETGTMKPSTVILFALAHLFRVPVTDIDPDVDFPESCGREFLKEERSKDPKSKNR